MAEHALHPRRRSAPRSRDERASRRSRAEADAPKRRTAVAHQFDDAVQQREAGRLGMWVFLATEVLFFGVLFAAYTFTRLRHPEAWAEASRMTDVVLGSANTAVLLTSSLTMALAVDATRARDRRRALAYLGATLVLGLAFLAVKGLEYAHDYREHLVPLLDFAVDGPHRAGIELFFCFYFGMTAIHALHLAIGLGVIGTLLGLAWRRRARPAAAELSALYWHLVDIVWIFLYPLLYLVSRT